MIGTTIELVDKGGLVHLTNNSGRPLCGTQAPIHGHIALSSPASVTAHLPDPVCRDCRSRAQSAGITHCYPAATLKDVQAELDAKHVQRFPSPTMRVTARQGHQVTELQGSVDTRSGIVSIEETPGVVVTPPVRIDAEFVPPVKKQLTSDEYKREGWDAQGNGMPREDCPYTIMDPGNARHYWLQGWAISVDRDPRP